MNHLSMSDTPTTDTQSVDAATIHARAFPTPVGQLVVLVQHNETDGAAVIASGFCPIAELVARLDLDSNDVIVVESLKPFENDIVAYLNGDGDALARITTRQPGTALQQQVWAGLRAIPSGNTATYSELAAQTDSPRAVRAAGSACGRNLIAPFVPCHRALRSDGSLGGYYYGLEVKRWLLELEGVPVPA